MVKTIDKNKILNYIFWLLVFIGLMAFFYSSHPLVLFDSDDWLYASFSRDAIPIAYNWNPTRVLPECLQPLITLIGAYVIYPIMDDYIMAIALAYAIVLCIVICVYFYYVYKLLLKRINLETNKARVMILLFIFLHFLIYRTTETNNEYIFFSHNVNCIFFYVIPTLLNIIIVLYFETSDYPFKNQNIFKESIVILLIYLSIFSNLFSSYILGIWAGIKCLFIIIDLIKNKKKINKQIIIDNLLYIGIVLLWLISMGFELTGGRFKDVEGISLSISLLEGIKIYVHKYLSLNRIVL